MNKTVKIHDIGLVDYEEALNFQLKLFNEIIDTKISNRKNRTNTKTKNHLVFVEHNSVYTLGKSGKISNLLLNENDLKKNDIKFYNTNRGGDITYHGPGQIVCYPILDLDNFFTDVHKYLRFLEETIILTLRDYGIKGERSENETGVWLDVNTSNPRKICALGVKASRWVTMHGLALNVNNDLSYFNDIVPCGIKDKSVTSISIECKKNIEENFLKEKIIKNFLKLFSATKKV
ncbi:MAG: lipoyl(octanoyl) transferase LipB [Flavobacteriaceae bacterium]|jgi:lipoyl(octanoyl) transferase|nr:lipoyl(octanoyl) transferase LipB [Flavobacteriaceae bacterium]MDG2368343.1 lipoyl(octanoyl) transferase LipB [Flavobacteriaceae bacterium]|tara:strand:- start:385 stop:1083 length:699 start_codon:yes stop_codon:yes gene_type:complete